MAGAAQRHVHVLTSDHRLTVFAGGAEGETRVLFAQLTDGIKLLNLLALGQQTENVREGASQESALKR